MLASSAGAGHGGRATFSKNACPNLSACSCRIIQCRGPRTTPCVARPSTETASNQASGARGSSDFIDIPVLVEASLRPTANWLCVSAHARSVRRNMNQFERLHVLVLELL